MINITLGKWDARLHGSKTLWIEQLRLLCAADIHFEKGSFFHQFGSPLPPYDSDETLDRLTHNIDHFQPDIFIALGDSFHDAQAVERMEESQKTALNAVIRKVQRWVWVTGNHDPLIDSDIEGERLEQIAFGHLMFRHELTDDSSAEVSGHYHPKMSVKLKGRNITAPCFVMRQQKLILPSFGSYTGGLDVNDKALLNIMPNKERYLYLVHKERIYAL